MKPISETYNPSVQTYTGALIHPVLNPRDAGANPFDEVLWKVRLDDRGDLCAYVWMWNSGDACEIAEEHAARQGWEVNEDDVSAFGVDDDERAIVLDASVRADVDATE